MEKLWTLSEIDILQDLSPAELDVIAQRAPMQTVKAGTVFYSPEEQIEVLFILKQGRVRIFQLSSDGKSFTSSIINAGTIFGEMALVGQKMYNNYAEAMDACVICLMSSRDVRQLLLSDERIAARIAEMLGRRLLSLEQRLNDFAFKSVPQRIASTLLTIGHNEPTRAWPFGTQYPEVKITHEQLGELVGVYRETVTKILNELREQGLIELKRGRIGLLNPTGLAEIADL